MRNPSVCFDDTLHDCVTAIQEQGKTVAECLAYHPDLREELEPLLCLTVRLRAARTLQAPPELRRVSPIRVRNSVAARPHRVEQAITTPNLLHLIYRRVQAFFGMHRRLRTAITVGVVFAVWLMVGGGVIYASVDALPGEVLYPVKRTVESVQLAASLNDASDARLHLVFADRRLDEVAALVEKGRVQDIGPALVDYEAQVELVVPFLSQDSGLPPSEQVTLADLLVAAQAHHEAQFTVLLDYVPEDTREAIHLAVAASRAARDQALEVVAGKPTPTEPPPPTPVLGQPPSEVPALTPVPTQPPTMAPPPTPVPTQLPVPTPSAEPPGWPTLPRPTEWPTSPAWPTHPVPTQLPVPTPSAEPPGWPTLPWPTKWPTPPAWATYPAPTQLPIPTPSAEPPGWPTLPWPTEWPIPP